MTYASEARLPPGWELRRLSDLVDPDRAITYGIVQPGAYDPNGVLLVRGKDYSGDWVSPVDCFRVTPEIDRPYRRSRIQQGDLLLTIVGAGTGTVRSVPPEFAGANITQTTARIAIAPEFGPPSFVQYYLDSPFGRREVHRFIKGAAQPGLNIGDVEKFLVVFPPRPEREAMSHVIEVCDRQVEALNALLRAKLHLRKGLMQELLTGKRRLPGFGDAWRSVAIGDVLESVDRRVAMDDHAEYKLASVRRHWGGVFARGTLSGKEIKTKNLRQIQAGELLISHIQAAYGAIALVPEEFDGWMVSDLYTCLRPGQGEAIDIEFMAYLAQQPRMAHLARISSDGFFAERLRLLFKEEIFLKQRISIPSSMDEQRAIAKVLNTLDRELQLLGQLSEAYAAQKRGLMEELLTGKRRLPTEVRA